MSSHAVLAVMSNLTSHSILAVLSNLSSHSVWAILSNLSFHSVPAGWGCAKSWQCGWSWPEYICFWLWCFFVSLQSTLGNFGLNWLCVVGMLIEHVLCMWRFYEWHSVHQCYITWTQHKKLKVACACCFSGVLQVPVHTTEGQGPSGGAVPRRQDVLQLHGTSILHQHVPAGHRKPGWPRMGLPGRPLWNMCNGLSALVSPKEIAFSKYVSANIFSLHSFWIILGCWIYFLLSFLFSL